MNNTNRILEFEGLRGLLSWWVVANHLLLACGWNADNLPPVLRLIARGDYAVDVFIILSGFVIFKLIHDAQEPYFVFLTRRFFRLYPVFLTCLVLAVALRPLAWSNLQHWHENPVASLGLQNWLDDGAQLWRHIAAHLTLLHGAVPEPLLKKSATALLPPAWSISLEWQFYLVAPALACFLARTRCAGLLSFGVTLICAVFALHDPLMRWFPMQSFLLQKILYFWIGILSFQIWQTMAMCDDGLPDIFLAGITPLILFFTLSIPLALWSVVFTAALSREGGLGEKLMRPLRLPFMQTLGRISYSTYLSHVCCIWAAQWIIFKITPGVTRITMLFVLAPTAACLIFFVSWWMHELIEVPGMRLGRLISTRFQPIRGREEKS